MLQVRMLLEKSESTKEKPIKTDHVVNLVYSKDQHKPQKKLPEGKAAPKTVPD